MSNTYKIVNSTVPISTVTSNGVYTINNSSGYQISPNVTIKNDPSSLEVKGKIILNGIDLNERLTTIENILQIPERDSILEQKHPKLKKLYDMYINELSKARMWETLKGKDE